MAALDPFPPPVVYNQYLFAGWLQLVLGGDETGQFDETDGAAVGGVIPASGPASPSATRSTT